MLDALSITEEEAAGLSELAALDLVMAKDFAARAQAAEDPDTANDLARSYQRMARSHRQSLALKVRLAREIARAGQDAERCADEAARRPPPPLPPFPRDEARIDARVEELRPAMQRVIWAEHEPDDSVEFDPYDDMAGYYFDLLEERLDLYARDNRFGLEPLDEHVVTMCGLMALDTRLGRRWRDLPDPPPEAFTDPPPDPPPRSDWRGSG